jgi:glycerol uptake facilitator protein
MAIDIPSLSKRCLAEALGTFMLVFFGTGAVHAAVLLEALNGLWQVAVVWGLAVMLAIWVVGGISGAHINPAITAALAAWRGFPMREVGPYIASQTAGAFVASAVLFTLFAPYLNAKEQRKSVIRGLPGSEITAMCYGEYYPNPGGLAASSSPLVGQELVDRLRQDEAMFSTNAAILAEIVGTGLLALVVFAATDPRNNSPGAAAMVPFVIGMTVAVLICVLAPLTQASFNPARDFGPRLFAFLAGWGPIALPGPRNPGFLTVYILAPIAGAVLAGGVYTCIVRPQPNNEGAAS